MWLLSLSDDSAFSPAKPEGFGEADFSAKSGHCNGIDVNGIHAQGILAELFVLAMKETMTYCGKCICLCSKTTAIIVRTEKLPDCYWTTSIQDYSRIIRGTYVKLKLFRFSAKGFAL